MQSKMFPELAQKLTDAEGYWICPFHVFMRKLESLYPNDKLKAKKVEEILEKYLERLRGIRPTIEKELEEILNSDSVVPEQQQVQSSDQTQQTQQQNPAVDPQSQSINPQLQPIMDQLKLLIDSNNNNIQCIRQLQGIVSAQSADIYNAMNNLGTLTNRVNLIAAGYIEPFAKDLPDDVATGTSN